MAFTADQIAALDRAAFAIGLMHRGSTIDMRRVLEQLVRDVRGEAPMPTEQTPHILAGRLRELCAKIREWKRTGVDAIPSERELRLIHRASLALESPAPDVLQRVREAAMLGLSWGAGQAVMEKEKALRDIYAMCDQSAHTSEPSPLRAEAAPTPRCTCEAIFDGSEVPNWNIDPDCALHGRELPPAESPHWQPMDTAPKDGSRILAGAWSKRGKWLTAVVSWEWMLTPEEGEPTWSGWVWHAGNGCPVPTLWMQIPAPPDAQTLPATVPAPATQFEMCRNPCPHPPPEGYGPSSGCWKEKGHTDDCAWTFHMNHESYARPR